MVRSHDNVTADQLVKEYPTLDDDLIDTILLDSEAFRIDNKQVYSILKLLMVDGPGWPFIQGQNRSQNGRAAFLRLKQQAEGQSAVTTRKAKAYAEIATAIYSGKGRYTMDQYVARHQKAHNELEALGEAVAETKKVANFLKGINDPKLETGKTVVDGDNAKLVSFELCQQYFKTLVKNGKTRNVGSGATPRQIAVLTAPKKRKVNPKKHESKPKVDGGHYTAQDYRALTEDKRTQVRALREAAKAKKRKTAATTTSPDKDSDRQVSRVLSVSEEEDTKLPPSGPSTPKPQFGKNVYKRVRIVDSLESADAAMVTKEMRRLAPALVQHCHSKSKLISMTDSMLKLGAGKGANLPIYATCYVRSLRILASAAVTESRSNLDLHADTCCAGSNTLLIALMGRTVNVRPYSDEYAPLPAVPIATVATAWDDPETGLTYCLVIHECLYLGDCLADTLLNPNQLRLHGIRVDETPRQFNPQSLHAIVISQPNLVIPLSLQGVISGFPSRKPTPDKWENCPCIDITSDLEWEPNSENFATREEHLATTYVAGVAQTPVSLPAV